MGIGLPIVPHPLNLRPFRAPLEPKTVAFSLTINIDEIPEPGLTLQGELSQEWLASSLLEAYTAKQPVSVTLQVKRFHANVYVEGFLSTSIAFQCSRTLAPGTRELDIKVSELYQPYDANHVNLGEGVEAENIDDEMRTYEGKTFSLEEVLRELLVLAQDPYPTVDDASAPADPDSPLWQSDPEDVDPRWAALKNLKLN